MREYSADKTTGEQKRPAHEQSTNTAGGNSSVLLQLQHRYGNRYVQRLLALRKSEGEAEADPAIESAISQSRGGGQGLDSGIRLQMEGAFGADFSGVRVHTGDQAHSLNHELNAIAFTTGQDIFFRNSAYNPHSSEGKELLAHELTHVLQQGGGSSGVQGKLVVGAPGDRYEQEADAIARQVVTSLGSGSSSSLQRQCSCGGSTSAGSECEACRNKREANVQQATLQRTLQRQDGGGDSPPGPSTEISSGDGGPGDGASNDLDSGADCRSKCRQDFNDCIAQAKPPWWNPFGKEPLPGTPAYDRCWRAKVDCMRNCPSY